MATSGLVHTKRLSDTRIRELGVYYDKGGINYFDYSTKPKGIYFDSTVYEQAEGSPIKTLSVGLADRRPGVGYILVIPLDRYRPRALREVRERVETHAETIHALCDVGNAAALEKLKAILTGAVASDAAA